MLRLTLLLLGSAAAAWAQIRFVDGTEIALGDSVDLVARRVGSEAYPSTDPRPGQTMVNTAIAQFDFDQGRLWRMRLSHLRMVRSPLAPFRESWRNLMPLDTLKVGPAMKRESFDAYLAAWITQAEEAGKKEGVDYWIKHAGSPGNGRDLTILLGPRRRLVGTGRLTGDSWTFQFYPDASRANVPPEVEPGSLRSIEIVGDEYSTLRRGATGAGEDKFVPIAPDPARAGLILEDGTQLYFGMSKAEAERLTGRRSAQGKAAARSAIALDAGSVTFDEDRLYLIGYNPVIGAPQAFPEAWKNLTPVGARALSPGMTLQEFELYYDAWQARAATAGMVAGKHFTLEWTMIGASRTVRIALRAPSGDAETDSWRLNFYSVGAEAQRVWRLRSMTALCGEFFRSQPSPAPKLETKKAALPTELPPVELPLPELTLPKL